MLTVKYSKEVRMYADSTLKSRLESCLEMMFGRKNEVIREKCPHQIEGMWWSKSKNEAAPQAKKNQSKDFL